MFRDKRFWTFMSLYGVLILASVPLIMGLVPPNRWYGFRLPGALIDPQNWYEINALGGKMFVTAMLICAALNMLLFWKGTRTMVSLAGWINAGLILLSFWLVSLELVGRLPQ